VHRFLFIYQFSKSKCPIFRMRGPLKESISCFLIRLSSLVLVPIGLFHRTQCPLLYDFMELKVLAFTFHRTQSPLSLSFIRLKVLHLYAFKTINIFFTFQRLSESFVKTIKVFFTFQRLSEFFLKTIKDFFIFQRLSESFVKTINVFFAFQRLQCLLYFSKTSMSFVKRRQCLHLHFKRLHCLLSKDDNVFIYISKNFNVFSHLR